MLCTLDCPSTSVTPHVHENSLQHHSATIGSLIRQDSKNLCDPRKTWPRKSQCALHRSCTAHEYVQSQRLRPVVCSVVRAHSLPQFCFPRHEHGLRPKCLHLDVPFLSERPLRSRIPLVALASSSNPETQRNSPIQCKRRESQTFWIVSLFAKYSSASATASRRRASLILSVTHHQHSMTCPRLDYCRSPGQLAR